MPLGSNPSIGSNYFQFNTLQLTFHVKHPDVSFKFLKHLPKSLSSKFPVLFNGNIIDCDDLEFIFLIYDNNNSPVGCAYGEISDCRIHNGNLRPAILIHRFETNTTGQGYGRQLFEHILQLYNPYFITMSYLNGKSISFWKHMGFHLSRKSHILYQKFA